jgi:hypothetical protein
MTTVSPTDLDLTAARIRRAAQRTMGPAISEETAKGDAAIVHEIIDCVRQAYAIHPKPYLEFDVDHFIQTILRAAGGVSPKDHDAACSEGEWIMDVLTHTEKLMGRDDLYKPWLVRVCAHVENFDYSNLFEDERPSDDLSIDGVTFEDEVILEDNDDSDEGHHQRTRRRPYLQLVAEPKLITDEEMNRRFVQLMGGFEQTELKTSRQ